MKTTTSAADPRAFHKLQELVRDIDIAMVTTVSIEGSLRSRPMATRDFDDDGVMCFICSDQSEMAADLAAEPGVNVSYADPKKLRFVSVTGNATVLHDREIARKLWTPSLKTYFPNGVDDPHLAVVEVRIETAEYWDSPSGKMQRLFSSKARSEEGDEGEHTRVAIRAAPASG